uniref:Phosphate cytidylyltransferase 2, ethanolamine n=1 Tax=Hucho hucho TaxID=62062 RepID=A0A4W5LF12_9TELE
MGQCLSSEQDLTEEGKKAKLQSAKIDRDLYEYAKREMNVVKILMLGKSLLNSKGFIGMGSILQKQPAVLDNLLTSMKFVLHGMGILRINLTNSKNKVHAHSVLSCGRCFDEDQVLFPFIGHALSCLWADQGVREAAARGYEFELNDSALYFFENMGRIICPEYVPTETDVLRVRLRTTGVIETQFKVKHLLFRMYDVGGQRTERRKWIGCFEDVRAVVFVVSLSGYDMTLVEDPCMGCRKFLFINLLVYLLQILFMNKIDLFQEKILHSGRHLRLYVPQFKGADCDVDTAARYIAGMFVSLNATPSKLIYHHFTTATDTSNVQIVFQVVMDTIIKENLEAVSLL